MNIKTRTIVVLSDGQTWNTLSGCSILVINDQQYDDLCNDRIDAGDLMPLAEIGMADVTPPTDSDIAFENDNENDNEQQQTLAERLKELADSLGGDDGALVSEAIAYMEGNN